MPESAENRRPVHLIALGACLLAGGLVLDIVFGGGLAQGDGSIKTFSRFLSTFGLGHVQAGLLLVLLLPSLAGWLGEELQRVLRAASFSGLLAFAAGGVGVQALKHLIGRPRPRLNDIWGFAGPNLTSGLDSMPSGHAVTSFAIAIAVGSWLPRARWPLLVFAALIAVARVVLGSHYPLDICIGAVVGMAVGHYSARFVNAKLTKGPPTENQ